MTTAEDVKKIIRAYLGSSQWVIVDDRKVEQHTVHSLEYTGVTSDIRVRFDGSTSCADSDIGRIARARSLNNYCYLKNCFPTYNEAIDELQHRHEENINILKDDIKYRKEGK